MNDADFAQKQLAYIRSTMERATVYRSISAPTALVGGLLSIAAYVLIAIDREYFNQAEPWRGFLPVWLGVLALTAMTNAVVLWWSSRRHEAPVFSPAMRQAYLSVLPAFATAGICSFMTAWADGPESSYVFLWVLFYGLGLLSTGPFAPRSVLVLGYAFLLTGWFMILSIFMTPSHAFYWFVNYDDAGAISFLMALTFGGYHLIYAAAVWWLSRNGSTESKPEAGHV